MEKILLIGASGQARSVIDAIESSSQFNTIGILVDDAHGTLMKYPIIGTIEDAAQFFGEYTRAFIAIGDNCYRKMFFEKLRQIGYGFPVIRHCTSYVSSFSSVGEGTILHAKSFVNASCTVGENCIINTGSNIEHDCIIGDNVHISPGSTLCGNVIVGNNTWIGAGTVVKDKITIGSNVIIGAGSVVVTNIPDNVVCYGTPARIIRYITN